MQTNYSALKGSLVYRVNKRIVRDCAWELGDRVTLILSLPRALGTTAVKINIMSENGSIQFTKDLVWTSLHQANDIYEATVTDGNQEVGLYFYTVSISTPLGTVYCKKYGKELIFSKDHNTEAMQFSIVNFNNKENSPYTKGVIYHIFVDRFARDDKPIWKEGNILVDKWDKIPEFPEYPGAPLKNNTFYGGTLSAIVKKLDYLKSLNVSLIYLSPIFESPSNHKYDTADYMKVDSGFGGDEALKNLIKEAKKLGIGILLDGVFNHTGADSLYFNRYGKYGDGGAYNDPESPYRCWYDFKHYPDDYTCWWGIEILPRINTTNEDCKAFFIGSGGVIDKYSKMGIAGMRLDVVDELTDEFVKQIKSVLLKNNRQSLLYGEVWEDASNKIAYGVRKKYYLGEELDGVMNYPLRKGLISYLRGKNTDELMYALTDIIDNAPQRIRNRQMNILGSHDTERIITAIAGISVEGKSNYEISNIKMSKSEKEQGIKLVKSLYSIIATLPGVPTVYYGDEAGLEGYSDPFNRMPYPYGNESTDLLDHYRKIGNIRYNSDVLQDGSFELNILTSTLLVFTRKLKNAKIITVYNNSDIQTNIKFDATAKNLLTNETKKNFEIDANECLIFKTQSSTLTI